MNFHKIKYTLLFLHFSLMLFSQDIPEQVIRGKLTDALTGQALVGASVLLPGTMPIKGTTTNEDGKYRLENVPVGRYSIEATYLGYELLEIPGLLVESGKELVLDIVLFEQSESLNEIVVKSKRRRSNSLSPVSVQSITVEEVLRFPATFNDPARLATTYPGVVNTNDQANHISVRGNSPNSTTWRLEGVEIVNPNHLGDAGTSNGRPSVSGGGVNILSAQLLGTSNLYTSVFPVEYGNAIGGIMDMRFRNGNDEKHEFTAQAGLVGFDFSAEGPLSKKKGISYLVNYRYSFVGLLTAMGVDFGGEAISFQDVAFNVKVPFGKKSILKVFGMGGGSRNGFTGKDDPDEWEVDKDRYYINFTNRMGALGASYSNTFTDKLRFKFTAVASAVETNKRSDLIRGYTSSDPIFEGFSYDSLLHRKTALNADFVFKLNKKNQFQFGLSSVEQLFDVNTQNFADLSFGRDAGWLLGDYVQWMWQPINSIRIQLGLHYSYFTFNETSSLEPRASIQWQASLKNRFSFAYGLHSQLQPGQIYFFNTPSFAPNKNLDFSKSHHFVLNYTRKLGSRSELSLEAYYQSLFNIPTHNPVFVTSFLKHFSAINYQSDFLGLNMENKGTGRNYGIEINWRRFLSDGYFVLANTSLYQSTYEDQFGKQIDTRFNGQYLFNLTGGKEFNWRRKNKNRILGINARATYAGGLRRTPIDIERSIESFFTILDYDQPFSLQQKDYFKIDFRIYYKNNKSKYNSTFALDLQNLTNRKNDGYYYYDHQQEKVLAQKQLGLIPNLSYRVEF